MNDLHNYLLTNLDRLKTDLEHDISLLYLKSINESLMMTLDWKEGCSSSNEYQRVCVCLNSISNLIHSGAIKMASSRDYSMIAKFCDVRNLPGYSK